MVKFLRNRTDIQVEVDKAKKFLSNSKGEYNHDTVVKALELVFYNKCYLCEYALPNVYNIEHLIPHRNDVSLKTDWDNLFLSCGHCNNIKSDKYENILDCTKVHPDKSISFEYVADIFDPQSKSVVIKPLDQDTKTLATIELLNSIYYGNTPLKKLSADNLRKILHKEMTRFKLLLQNYLEHVQTNDTMAIDDDIFCIKQSLECSTSFTAFKRWYIIDNKDVFPVLYKYLCDEVYI